MISVPTLRVYAPAVLRIGMSLVYLWFGVSQLLDPGSWIGYLPSYIIDMSLKSTQFIIFNGIFEVVFGLLLIVGFFTRISAGLLALHLIGIMAALGYNDIMIRDLGLFFGLIAVGMHGPDKLSIDRYFKSKTAANK